MKKYFLLSPVLRKTGLKAWDWSVTTDNVVVCALLEKEARAYAFRDFERCVDPEILNVVPPWLDDDLVIAHVSNRLNDFIPGVSNDPGADRPCGVLAIGVQDCVLEVLNNKTTK